MKKDYCVFDDPAIILGKIYQVGYNAIQKELEKIAHKENIDLAYFGFKMTLEWYEKESETFNILRTYKLDKSYDIDDQYREPGK